MVVLGSQLLSLAFLGVSGVPAIPEGESGNPHSSHLEPDRAQGPACQGPGL